VRTFKFWSPVSWGRVFGLLFVFFFRCQFIFLSPLILSPLSSQSLCGSCAAFPYWSVVWWGGVVVSQGPAPGCPFPWWDSVFLKNAFHGLSPSLKHTLIKIFFLSTGESLPRTNWGSGVAHPVVALWEGSLDFGAPGSTMRGS